MKEIRSLYKGSFTRLEKKMVESALWHFRCGFRQPGKETCPPFRKATAQTFLEPHLLALPLEMSPGSSHNCGSSLRSVLKAASPSLKSHTWV